MANAFLIAKVVHIVGFVSWFAGLFYVVRLFIYFAEADSREASERQLLQDQYRLMQRRLWKIITRPAMVVTLLGGLTMLHSYRPVPLWLWIKLACVGMLLAYHHVCGRILGQQAKGTCQWSSEKLRFFNEGATVLLVAIVSLAVFKQGMSAVWGVVTLVGLGVSLMMGVRLYRKIRVAADGPAVHSSGD